VIRRFLISLVPALAVLTFLAGTPAHSTGRIEATSAQWNLAAGKPLPAKRALHEQNEVSSLTGWADDQDKDDRIVRTASSTSWPSPRARPSAGWPHQVILRTHPACAAPPRGPPTA
jgi:hypothetical protein